MVAVPDAEARKEEEEERDRRRRGISKGEAERCIFGKSIFKMVCCCEDDAFEFCFLWGKD